MDVAEIRELQSSLRAMLAEARDEPAAVSESLRELGWDDVVAEEPAAAALLFEEQGRAQVASALLDEAVLGMLGLDAGDAVVAYPLTTADPLWEPVVDVASELRLDALVRVLGAAPRHVVVPVGGSRLLVVPSTAVELTPVNGLDLDGGWARVSARCAVDQAWAVTASVDWRDAMAAARRLIAAELVGLARAALDLATAHVTERHQFGRAIGSFQSVRFRLAETKVAIEAAAEAIRVSFADGSPLAAAVAKALAGSAAETAVRHAAQVCGAMGLTWEYGLHPIIRRSFALDQLLGDTATLTVAMGRHVAESVEQPLLDPLVIPLAY